MPLSAGERLGPYEILAPIGAGGMGEVYKATDTRLGRTVAIKTLHVEHGDRFARESRSIAALNHPHICQLYDVGPNYLVMEFVEGSALRGPMPAEEAVRLAVEIADALDTAHARGIIHRDLKPGNILLTKSGVKLLDFGLAKLESPGAGDETATQTQAGTVVGTAPYMSPEQASGKPVDARSDIFAFGAVLYEMLSGRRAFEGDTAFAVVANVLHRDPDPLPVAPGLQRVLSRCLRKSPADRFPSMAEVRRELVSAGLTERLPSIAVLPFTNMSGDHENEYFSDGLSEEIINALAKVPGLKVTARTSAFAFRGRNEDLRRVGDALNVGHILEGSVRKAGNRVRITSQLITVADGCQLWSERYDREMTDIFAIQDDISQAIVGVLKVKLGRDRELKTSRRGTTNQAAYDAWLEGRYNFQQLTEGCIVRARDCYERALHLDPDYAAPNAGVAESYMYLALYGKMPTAEAIPRALETAERAIALDPEAPEGYLARGLIRGGVQWNWPAAGQDFDKALALQPESVLAHYRRGIWYLLGLGRMDEAIAAVTRAVELDPLSTFATAVLALLLHIAGRDEEAAPRIRSAVAHSPVVFFSCLMGGIILGGCGFLEEAESVLSQGLQANAGNTWLLSHLALVRGRAGNREGVQRVFSEVSSLPAQKVPAIVWALMYAASGDPSTAAVWVDKIAAERQIWTSPLVRSPMIATALAGPHFDALLHAICPA